MIKICIISPASHLEKYSSLGDCEMALTHLVLSDAGFHHSEYVTQNYVKYFKTKSQEGKFIILDNSAYEIGNLEKSNASGSGLGPELVLRAAEILEPSIVICQDVLCDKDATLEATKYFINQVKKKGLFAKFQLMGVPQGRTKDEWLSCYEEMLKIPEINQIGFSKISVPVSFLQDQKSPGCVTAARLLCTGAVDELFKVKKPAHLLGGDNKLAHELSQQARYKWIRSNDSSAAVQYGIFNQVFDTTTGMIPDIITAKPDLENLKEETFLQLEAASSNILHNIATLHKMSKGSKWSHT